MEAEYRKYKNGMEFLKLKNGMVQSVLNTEDGARIICSSNKYLVQHFRDDTITLESNQSEFSSAMIKALEQINKMD